MDGSKQQPEASALPASAVRAAGSASDQGGHGILLYYKYVILAGREAELAAWYEAQCSGLGQKGRIRVAADGVNVTVRRTVGGAMAGLGAHMEAVRGHPIIQGADIDFKELVSLGAGARSAADPFSNGGRHLPPRAFHDMLERAAAEGAGGGGCQTVLIDARNAYETQIGRFDVSGVELMDPRTRAFSELPAWMDAHESALAGKRVLMYCTGGVRCERASAYLREKGPAFAEVYQLSGGVQRYLEEFPDGGLFAGKLFV
ncbi:hypothetical protein MNEG_7068 [Monoraphidium neglectum]|uniref:Rhodanese domain-containing protein n=1 Tax=Monoraphidium neglectum TaxID=145388 RepID=A0A0D2L0D5_9CHLO|nr:hypothetical protein MNEG_7068 [Monoraphidium neglectum]KIZ00894.1 hypothetical protein MNEG_7068 [Monoraphidium neglectum]|eukprot:XP_013899913.1 hypothetical protein MNEG_7068 [Monoraphidium neglectum]